MWDKVKAWPLWAKIIVGLVVAWFVVQVTLFAVSTAVGHRTQSTFNDLQNQVDK